MARGARLKLDRLHSVIVNKNLLEREIVLFYAMLFNREEALT